MLHRPSCLIHAHDFHVLAWRYAALLVTVIHMFTSEKKNMPMRTLQHYLLFCIFVPEIELRQQIFRPKVHRRKCINMSIANWKWLWFRQHRWGNGSSRARASRTAAACKGLARASCLDSRSRSCWRSGLNRSPMAGDGWACHSIAPTDLRRLDSISAAAHRVVPCLCSGTSRWGVRSVSVRLDAGSTWQTERAAAVREKFQAFAIAGAGGLIELVHGDAGCRWRYCSTVLRLLIISLPMAVTSSFPRHLKFQEPDGSRCICWGLNRACRKSRNVRTLWNHQNDITSLINNHFMLLRTNWKKLTNFKFYLLNVSPYEWNNFDNCNMLLNIWMKPPRIIWCPENRTEWCRKLIIWPLDVQVKNSK